MAIAIDTLAYAKRLKEAGFSEMQAEGQAHALAAAMSESIATKQDLRELEARMDARFTVVDERFAHIERLIDARLAAQSAHFDGRLADLERRMSIRLGALMVGGIAVVSVIVKLG